MKRKISYKLFTENYNLGRLTSSLVIISTLSFIGYKLINGSNAETPYASSEAESGTLTSPATVVSGSGTSGSQFVQFGTNETSTGSLPLPAGYNSSQLIFDDQFKGTTLDSSKWSTYLGANGNIWNNFGGFPLPYSGPNSIANGGNGYQLNMYGPSQVTVNNGLTITAQKNTNQFAATNPWISGVINTEGKFTLPSTGWYVQVKAQMPDQSQGMWPGIWFLPGISGTPSNELDGYEGGFTSGSTEPNTSMHSDYFADQGQQQSLYVVPNVNNYNVYGIEYLPGKSIKVFVNGNQMFQVIASSNVTITAEPYEILLDLDVASNTTSGFRTITNANTPTSSMKVAEVQAYSN